jgi:Flp pilus assembly protein TadG
MNIWIAVQLRLLSDAVRERATEVWRTRDRGSMATEFAIVAAAIIGIALLVVYLFTTFAEEKANQIGKE